MQGAEAAFSTPSRSSAVGVRMARLSVPAVTIDTSAGAPAGAGSGSGAGGDAAGVCPLSPSGIALAEVVGTVEECSQGSADVMCVANLHMASINEFASGAQVRLLCAAVELCLPQCGPTSGCFLCPSDRFRLTLVTMRLPVLDALLVSCPSQRAMIYLRSTYEAACQEFMVRPCFPQCSFSQYARSDGKLQCFCAHRHGRESEV
jgi:hypothetical protein